MSIAVLLLAAFGHAVLWAAIVNRLHGTSYRQSIRAGLSALCLLLAIALPVAVAAILSRNGIGTEAVATWATTGAWSYVGLCAAVLVGASINWSLRLIHPERRGTLIANHTARIDARADSVTPLAAAGLPALLCRLPGNQVLEIHVHEKELSIARLSRAQDGVRIAHISDLHMSGRIAKGYFERVVAEVNRAAPDLVAVTGDIVEYDKCLDWIPDTLGQLRAPAGIFYVLGNHDRKVDYKKLTTALAGAGLVHLGGQRQRIVVRDGPVELAGNELPWFGPVPEMARPTSNDSLQRPLRILLAHTPDQFGWAQRVDFDLMLAGHNHGGQVRLPGVGPVLAPSLNGVRYAAGVFRRGGTVMHVSRGTSALTPVRFNCPPEVAILTLRCANAEA